MTCLLHVLLEDSDGTTLPALLEVRSGSRAAQQLREGHALLLLGARVSELSASHTWPSEAMSSAAPWVQQQSMLGGTLGGGGAMQLPAQQGDKSVQPPAQQGTLGGSGQPIAQQGSLGGSRQLPAQQCGGLVLLWQESGQGCHLYDLSAIPGILNSPALNELRTLAVAVAALKHSPEGGEAGAALEHSPEGGEAVAALAGGEAPTEPQTLMHSPEASGSTAAASVKATTIMTATCTVDVIGADINTLRVHRCGDGMAAAAVD